MQMQSKTAGSVDITPMVFLLDVSSATRNHRISVLFTCLLCLALVTLGQLLYIVDAERIRMYLIIIQRTPD
jgi:hypothetical protein